MTQWQHDALDLPPGESLYHSPTILQDEMYARLIFKITLQKLTDLEALDHCLSHFFTINVAIKIAHLHYYSCRILLR